MWKFEITNFSGSTRVRCNLCNKPHENSYKYHTLWNYSSLATFLWGWQLRPMFITQSPWSAPNATTYTFVKRAVYAKRTLSWIGYSRSFKVILIGVGRNPEASVIVMYNKVDLISETYEDSNGKTQLLQIRRFQPPHSGFTTVFREKPWNIYKYCSYC